MLCWMLLLISLSLLGDSVNAISKANIEANSFVRHTSQNFRSSRIPSPADKNELASKKEFRENEENLYDELSQPVPTEDLANSSTIFVRPSDPEKDDPKRSGIHSKFSEKFRQRKRAQSNLQQEAIQRVRMTPVGYNQANRYSKYTNASRTFNDREKVMRVHKSKPENKYMKDERNIYRNRTPYLPRPEDQDSNSMFREPESREPSEPQIGNYHHQENIQHESDKEYSSVEYSELNVNTNSNPVERNRFVPEMPRVNRRPNSYKRPFRPSALDHNNPIKFVQARENVGAPQYDCKAAGTCAPSGPQRRHFITSQQQRHRQQTLNARERFDAHNHHQKKIKSFQHSNIGTSQQYTNIDHLKPIAQDEDYDEHDIKRSDGGAYFLKYILPIAYLTLSGLFLLLPSSLTIPISAGFRQLSGLDDDAFKSALKSVIDLTNDGQEGFDVRNLNDGECPVEYYSCVLGSSWSHFSTVQNLPAIENLSSVTRRPEVMTALLKGLRGDSTNCLTDYCSTAL